MDAPRLAGESGPSAIETVRRLALAATKIVLWIRTCAVQACAVQANVCFGPIADISATERRHSAWIYGDFSCAYPRMLLKVCVVIGSGVRPNWNERHYPSLFFSFGQRRRLGQ